MSMQLAIFLLYYLAENAVSIEDCRGQSYDNASNMSGRYKGMQAHIKQRNAAVIFVPCAAHSLNLVGQSTASYCAVAVGFFDIVPKIYAFFCDFDAN